MIEHRTLQRRVILASLFTAVGIAAGRLMAGVPNVEFMTLVVFLGGAFCGARAGAAIGSLVMLAHSLLNPLGPAPPPLLLAQVAGYAAAGLGGGFFVRGLRLSGPWGVLAGAAAGFAVTVVYDALTTLATAFVALGAAGFREGLGGIVVAGIVFSAIHVGVNTALFAVAVPPILATGRAARTEEAA